MESGEGEGRAERVGAVFSWFWVEDDEGGCEKVS